MFYECSNKARAEGEVFGQALYPNQGPTQVQPVCSRERRNIPKELNERASEGIERGESGRDQAVVIKEMLEEEYPVCDTWFPYTPMRSPAQHLEDLQMQQLEQRRQDFELRLHEMSRRVQEDSKQILADSKQIAADSVRTAEAAESSQRRVTWIVAALAFVTLVLVGIQVWQNTRTQTVQLEGPMVVVTPTVVPPSPTPIPPTPTLAPPSADKP